jgi:AraC family transcriptional regulator
MHIVDLGALPATSPCAVVARGSRVPPVFVVEDAGRRLVAARWRRREVHLDEPTCLDAHLLSYCVRGGARSTLMLDGRRRHSQQQAGAVSFLPAGRPVQWQFEAPGEVDHVHVYVSEAALREHCSGAGLPSLVNTRDPWLDAFFRLLIADVEPLAREGRLDDFDLLDRLGEPLLRRLARLLPASARDDGPPAPRVSPLRPALLRRIEAHIDDHLDAELHLGQLAQLASMSVDHFVRAFHQATGVTPHRHLLERRLERACTLLSDTDVRVSEVARRCGFAGAAHFSATFHQHYGITPTGYRRHA